MYHDARALVREPVDDRLRRGSNGCARLIGYPPSVLVEYGRTCTYEANAYLFCTFSMVRLWS
jgi:hypothetical protein